MPNISDYIWQNVSGAIVPRTLVWVRLTNNASGISYVSTSQTDANGLFSVNNVPSGTYTVATGPTGVGAWTNTGDTAYIVANDSPWVNVQDYGAKGDGIADDTVALQLALNAQLTSSKGGIVFLPIGTYLISSTLYVPSRTQLIGAGRDGSTIKASGSFPINTALINLGDNVNTIAFSCRIENLMVDANNIAGSICVKSDQINEESGVFRCILYRFVDSGFKSLKGSGAGAQNYTLRDVECIGDTGAISTTSGIKVDGNGQGPPWGFDNISVVFTTGYEPTVGLQLDGMNSKVSNIHVEHCTDGLLIGSLHQCTDITIENVMAGPNVTNAVHISNATVSNAYTLIGIGNNGTGATNHLLDDRQGLTIVENIGFYAVGGGTAGAEGLLTNTSTVSNRFITSTIISQAGRVVAPTSGAPLIVTNVSPDTRQASTNDLVSGRATEIRSVAKDGYYGITLNTPTADIGGTNSSAITYDVAGVHKWSSNMGVNGQDVTLAFYWPTPADIIDIAGDGTAKILMGNGIGAPQSATAQLTVSSGGTLGAQNLDAYRGITNFNSMIGFISSNSNAGNAAGNRIQIGSDSFIGNIEITSSAHATRPNRFDIYSSTNTPLRFGSNGTMYTYLDSALGLLIGGTPPVSGVISTVDVINGDLSVRSTTPNATRNIFVYPAYNADSTNKLSIIATTGDKSIISSSKLVLTGTTLGLNGAATFNALLTVSTGGLKTSNDTLNLTVASVTAATQTYIGFADQSTVKWQLGKQADHSFYLFDSVGSRSIMSVASNSGGISYGVGFGTTENTVTNGDAGFIQSNSITGGNILELLQTTSTMTGIGLKMNLANASGTFNGKFVDFLNNTTSKFSVSSTGKLISAAALVSAQGALGTGSNFTPDAATANSFTATLNANATFNAPTNPATGQRIHFAIIQNGTGGFTVTWNAVFKVTWSDTGNTLNKRSTIAFLYDGTNWNQDGAQAPYV